MVVIFRFVVVLLLKEDGQENVAAERVCAGEADYVCVSRGVMKVVMFVSEWYMCGWMSGRGD